MARKDLLESSHCHAMFMGMPLGNLIIAIMNCWQEMVAERFYYSTAF
jgi:hypothetical protein